ncbi:MAG: hypothetical protein Q8Q14_04665 [Gemmatimonadales bacterium]|nr:hypothetical protein [Gemmatimonadales bacterium]
MTTDEQAAAAPGWRFLIGMAVYDGGDPTRRGWVVRAHFGSLAVDWGDWRTAWCSGEALTCASGGLLLPDLSDRVTLMAALGLARDVDMSADALTEMERGVRRWLWGAADAEFAGYIVAALQAARPSAPAGDAP